MNEPFKISSIQKGDISAFERLFREYYEQLCQWAYRYLHDRDDSEEVVQDLFYHIWLNRESLYFRVSFKSYMYKSVANNCKMILRQKRRRLEIENELAGGSAGPDDPEYVLESEQLNEVLNQTLENLPARTAEVFMMSRYEGKKYAEIAEILKISIKTVEANMSKALALFRKNLKKYIHD